MWFRCPHLTWLPSAEKAFWVFRASGHCVNRWRSLFSYGYFVSSILFFTPPSPWGSSQWIPSVFVRRFGLLLGITTFCMVQTSFAVWSCCTPAIPDLRIFDNSCGNLRSNADSHSLVATIYVLDFSGALHWNSLCCVPMKHSLQTHQAS